MAKTSKTMLNNSGESGQPCLVPDFKGNVLNFSPLRIMFDVGLSYMDAGFVKGFFCMYRDDHMVFFFQFVIMVYHVD